MAQTKAVQNAAEASGKAQQATKKAGRAGKPKGEFEIPKDEAGWMQLADSLNIDSVAAKQLYNNLIPELQAAGYPNAQIKGILQADDPHMAARAFIADERAALSEALSKSNFGYKPEQINAMNLRDLKNTVDDAVTKKKGRPSGIRGKDADASTTVESRVPDEKQTASTTAELAATPAQTTVPSGQQRMTPFERYLAENPFSQDSTAAPQGAFQTEVVGPRGDFQATSRPGGGITKPFMADVGPAAPKTQSMAAIGDAIQGIKPKKTAAEKPAPKVPLRDQPLDGARTQVELANVGEPADRGSGAIVVGQDFRPGQTVGIADATPARGGAASPGVQPAPAPEVAAGTVDAGTVDAVLPPDQTGPSIMETDPLLRAGAATVGATKKAATKAWPTLLAATGLTAATLYGLGAFGSRKQQPAAGPQPAGPGVMPPPQGGSRIIILPKDVLNQMEQRPMRQQPPMPPAPQPMPPQAAPPQARPAGPGQTTDIIRALSGRMA